MVCSHEKGHTALCHRCHGTELMSHRTYNFTTLRNEFIGFWVYLRDPQHANGNTDYTLCKTCTYRTEPRSTQTTSKPKKMPDYLPRSKRTHVEWHFIVWQFRFHALFIIISYHFAAFLFMVMSLTHLNRMCFYCFSFRRRIVDAMTWWNYVRVWANNEWVNERRKEAANYIDKHQLCSKTITWLWKIELIDVAAWLTAPVAAPTHTRTVFIQPWKCWLIFDALCV